MYGGIDYSIGEEITVEFAGMGILLYDRISGKMISTGKIEL